MPRSSPSRTPPNKSHLRAYSQQLSSHLETNSLTLYSDEGAFLGKFVDEVLRGLRGRAGTAFQTVLHMRFLYARRTKIR